MGTFCQCLLPLCKPLREETLKEKKKGSFILLVTRRDTELGTVTLCIVMIPLPLPWKKEEKQEELHVCVVPIIEGTLALGLMDSRSGHICKGASYCL